MNTQIKVTLVPETTSLYRHYSGQTKAQAAFLEVEPGTRQVTCWVNPEIGNAVPFAVFHKKVLRFGIPTLTGSAANEMMADKDLQALVTRICAGFEEVWDGHNFIGKYTEDAEDAQEDLEILCERWEGEQVCPWDAEQWFASDKDSIIEKIQTGLIKEDASVIESWLEENKGTCEDSYLVLTHVTDYAEELLEEAQGD